MKKIILILFIISTLLFVGCSFKQEVSDNQDNSQDSIYTNIVEELGKTQFLANSKLVTNNNDTYALQGEIWEAYFFNQEEIDEFMNDGSIVINNNVYYIRKKDNNVSPGEYMYVLFSKNSTSNVPDYYIFKDVYETYSVCDKYSFPLVHKTGIFKQIVFEKDIMVDMYDNMEPFENVLKNAWYIFGPNDSGLINLFKFSFKNENCDEITIIQIAGYTEFASGDNSLDYLENIQQEQEDDISDNENLETKKRIVNKTWNVGLIYDSEGNQSKITRKDLFGSIYSELDGLKFYEDNTFTNNIGIAADPDIALFRGTYKIEGLKIFLEYEAGKKEEYEIIEDGNANILIVIQGYDDYYNEEYYITYFTDSEAEN